MKAVFSTDLTDFLRENIHSVRQLELLLYMFHNRDKEWSTEAASRATYCTEGAASRWMEIFLNTGLLVNGTTKGHYRFAPKSQKHMDWVSEIASEYKSRPHKVVEIIANQETKES